MSPSPLKTAFRTVVTYGAIIAITAALFDVVCIATGLFPPTQNPGHATLGWLPARPTGAMAIGVCVDANTGERIQYRRNEDAIRTWLSRDSIVSADQQVRLAVVGDSHTELCFVNEELHAGVLETGLRDDGINAVALSFGVGRYSPLQAYLAYREVLRPYRPAALILNFYTGNDFYDLLRVDDRPHLAPNDSGYVVAPPVWYTQDDPARPRRSRVLALARAIGDRTGVRTAFQRFAFLRRIGAREGVSFLDDVAYMRHLVAAREPSLGYPDALTAQMLNQQLYFHHHPGARDESLRRAREVLRMARAENPDLILVLSALPSYQLVGEVPVDSALIRATSRLPISLEDGQREEQALYDALRDIATEEGWLFVDNLAALRSHGGPERLFNGFDYHLDRIASAIVGRTQHDTLLTRLRAPQQPQR